MELNRASVLFAGQLPLCNSLWAHAGFYGISPAPKAMDGLSSTGKADFGRESSRDAPSLVFPYRCKKRTWTLQLARVLRGCAWKGPGTPRMMV